MFKLGGTEKSHGKALVFIIHIFATFLKVPLEAHEAQEGETNGRMNDPSKKSKQNESFSFVWGSKR